MWQAVRQAMEGVCFTCCSQQGSLCANLILGPAASKEVREKPRAPLPSWLGTRPEKLHSLLERGSPPWVRSHWTTQGSLRRSLRKYLGARTFSTEDLAWAKKSSGRKEGLRHVQGTRWVG